MSGLPEGLIVGHQPQLGELIASLTGSSVLLKPGGIASIETNAGAHAALLWSQNP